MKQNSKYLLLFLLLTFCLNIRGNDILCPNADTIFISLDEESYPIKNGQLPIYTASVKVGEAVVGENFDVQIKYPEYKILTRAEWKHLKLEEIPQNINIDVQLSFSRKEGYVDITFCPIVKRHNEILRLTSCKLNIKRQKVLTKKILDTKSSQETETKRWKSHSVLKEGKWVKIRVSQEGIYALTPSFLRQKGFTQPEHVKVYGYGGRILEEDWSFEGEEKTTDDLEEIPLFRKEDGTSLFFAEGTRRWTYNNNKKKWIHENNPYSSYSYYFVTEGNEPIKFTSSTSDTSAPKTINSILSYAVLDNDHFGWYEGGREMYDDYDFSYGQSKTFKLVANSPVPTNNKAEVDIAMSASSTSSATMVSLAHNGNTLGTLSIPKYSSFQSAYEVRRKFITEKLAKENTFKVTTNSNNSARLNFIRLNYNRILNAQDAPYSFSPNIKGKVQLQISNATSNTRLWKIGRAESPAQEMKGNLSGSTLQVNVENGKERYVIVDISQQYPTPEWDQTIKNQDLHGDHKVYDMVILIPESNLLRPQAERLAQAHQARGLRVKVVNADHIFNEFSSGTPDATAYRRYLKMLYDRAKSQEDLPRYLLLFGDCSWDNRMISDKWKLYSPKDFLLSFEVTDGYKELGNTTFPLGEQNSYVTDDYFGWLDDNEGSNYTSNKIDLGIGRFPCHDTITAKILVDKSISYLNNQKTGAWKNTIYVLADNGNGNLHMRDAEEVVKQIEISTQQSSIIKKVYNDAYSRESSGTGHRFPTVTKVLKDAMYQGALIFNYTGHGSPDQLSHTQILKTPDFEEPSLGNLPLWIMASCEISPYDSQKNDIGRAAIHNPNGGAIAVMCASRSVYSNYNRYLNIAYNKYLFGFDELGRKNTLGDALRQTKVELITPSAMGGIKDNSINKLKYVLLGDPALPLTSPTGKVVLDSINGAIMKTGDKLQLKAGSLVRFSGHVTDSQNESLHNFKGALTATMTDKIEDITCKNNDGTADEPMVYQERTKKIFEGSDSIINGKFALSFRIPKDISYSNESGRITFYAVNDDHSIECNGFNEQFYLNGTDTTFSPDTLSPQVYVYLDTPDFPNGGITSRHPVFFANISDDAGINSTGIGIGHDIELVLDNDHSNPIPLNNSFKYKFGSYNEGTVVHPLENLSQGKHKINFKIWDVNGNSTTKELDFYVQDGINKDFDVNVTENPTRHGTHLVTTFTDETEQAHIVVFEIFNIVGQKVWQSNPINISTGSRYGIAYWNLGTNLSARVPSGIYLYKAIISGDNYKKESKAKKIIVLEQ